MRMITKNRIEEVVSRAFPKKELNYRDREVLNKVLGVQLGMDSTNRIVGLKLNVRDDKCDFEGLKSDKMFHSIVLEFCLGMDGVYKEDLKRRSIKEIVEWLEVNIKEREDQIDIIMLKR